MKKLLVVGLTVVLVFAVSLASWADVAVKFNGEGNLGYKFTEDNAELDDGANFGDFTLMVTADVADNVSFYSEIKTEYTAGKSFNKDNRDSKDEDRNAFFIDEMFATLKYDPVTLKIGYYGFGFGGDKDIVDAAMCDLKSQVGIQAETTIAEGITAKVYYPSKGDDTPENTWGGFGLGLDYRQDLFGIGVVYGQTDVVNSDDSITAYAVNAYYIPITDLKAFVSYSVKELDSAVDKDNTNIIVGAIYTPADLPFEFRVEYDADSENEVDGWAKDFNPWGVRAAYKLNPNAKIQLERNQKAPDSQATELKLNIIF